VDYGKVVRLMAELQSAGASSIGLITETPRDDE
jgi:biopolymer transport protein TolR